MEMRESLDNFIFKIFSGMASDFDSLILDIDLRGGIIIHNKGSIFMAIPITLWYFVN